MADKIDFSCEKCGQLMSIEAAQSGAVIDCPRCHGQVLIPPAPLEGHAKPVVREGWKTKPAENATVIVTDVHLSWWNACDIVGKVMICATVISAVFAIIGWLLWMLLELILMKNSSP